MKEKKLLYLFLKKLIKMQWFLEWLMSPFIAEVPHMCQKKAVLPVKPISGSNLSSFLVFLEVFSLEEEEFIWCKLINDSMAGCSWRVVPSSRRAPGSPPGRPQQCRARAANREDRTNS